MEEPPLYRFVIGFELDPLGELQVHLDEFDSGLFRFIKQRLGSGAGKVPLPA